MRSHSPRFLFVLLLLALAVRLLDLPSVHTTKGWSWAGGPDAWYQARRADLAQSGTLTAHDYGTNFPEGETVHWPTTYSRTLGILERIAGPAGMAAFPVAGGCLAVLLFTFIAAHGPRPRFTAAIYAMLPAAVYPTVFGAIDHHSLEAAWFLAALVGSARRDRAGIALAGSAIVAALATVPAWPLVVLAAVLPPAIRSSSRRLAVPAILLAVVTVPLAGFSYFSDPWILSIEECKPLLGSGRDVLRAVVMLSPGILVLPVDAMSWWKRRADPWMAAALTATAIALPLTLIQARFCLYLAIPAALALGELIAWLSSRQRAPALLVAALSFLPPLRGIDEIRGWPVDPDPAVRDALEFLRTGTPSPGDFHRPDLPPSYGVVAAWDLGHHVLAIGQRPAIANAFHTGRTGRDAAAHVLFDTPVLATAEADSLPARYLLLTNLAGGYAQANRLPGQPAPVESLYGRLYFRGDPGLGWTRVHASVDSFVFEDVSVPQVQVWERAAGPSGDSKPGVNR